MVECPNCNRNYDDEFKFCPYCGEKKQGPRLCPNCEYKAYDEEFLFCPECGERLISKKEHEENLEKFRIEEIRDEIELREKIERKKENESKHTKKKSLTIEYLKSLDEKIESLEKLYFDTKDEKLVKEISNTMIEKEKFLRNGGIFSNKSQIDSIKKKTEMISIVNSSDIDPSAKRKLFNKINKCIIKDEASLKNSSIS